MKPIFPKNISKVLRSGWVPGSEVVIIKMVLGITFMVIGLYSAVTGYAEYTANMTAHFSAMQGDYLVGDDFTFTTIENLSETLNNRGLTSQEQLEYINSLINKFTKYLKDNPDINNDLRDYINGSITLLRDLQTQQSNLVRDELINNFLKKEFPNSMPHKYTK